MRRRSTTSSAAPFSAQEGWLTPDRQDSVSGLDRFLEAPLVSQSRIPSGSLAGLLHDLAASSAAGRSHVSALTALAKAHGPTDLGALCDELAAGVSRGQALSDVLESRNDLFEPAAVVLVRAGERYGQPSAGLEQAARTMEAGRLRSSRSRLLMAHTLLAAAVAGLGLTGMAVLVRPVLEHASSGHLPLLTSALLTMAHFLPVPLVAGLLIALGTRLMPRASGRRQRRSRASGPALPEDLARAADIVGWLASCGATPAEALAAAARTAFDDRLAASLDRAADLAAAGQRLGEALSAEEVLAELAAAATSGGDDVAGAMRRFATRTTDATTGTERHGLAQGLAQGAVLRWQLFTALVWIVWLAGVFVPVTASLR